MPIAQSRPRTLTANEIGIAADRVAKQEKSGRIHSASFRQDKQTAIANGKYTTPKDTPGLPGEQGTTPTVVTDANIRERIIPDIKTEAEGLLGPTEQEQQDKQNAQTGETPTEAPANEYDQLYQSVMGSTPGQDNFYDSELSLLDNMQKTSDQRTASSIRALTSTFNQRRAQQQAVTAGGAAEARNLLSRGGGNRSGSGSQVLSGIERAGIRELSVLDAEEQAAKAEALAAQTDNDYKTLGAKLDVLKEKRSEKLNVVGEMWKSIQDEKKETNKTINDTMKAATANGAPPEVINAIGAAQNPTEAYAAAGSYLLASNGIEGQAYNDAKRSGYTGSMLDFHRAWETAGRKPEVGTGGGTAGYNGDFEATVGLAANNMGSVYGQQALKDQLESSIAVGDWPSAATAIEQATAAGLSGENKTKFENAATDKAVLTGMKSALQAYKDAGGDMNLLKGKADDISKSLGVLGNDPKYAAIAVELDHAFQQYRQNMTGAAFGVAENNEYKKVLPQKTNTFDLNDAIITGALNYTDNYVKANVKNKTGQGGVEILDRANGAGTAQTIAQKEATAKQSVIDWAASDPANEEAYNTFVGMFPDASVEDIRQELGI